MKTLKIVVTSLLIVSLLATWVVTKDKKGDVNCNGKVTVTDLVILHRYIDGLEIMPCPKNADMNNDGKVDELDLNLLRNKLAGIK